MTEDKTKYEDLLPEGGASNIWQEEDETEDLPVSVAGHEVSVIHTWDPEEESNYGRTKYTVVLNHRSEDAPVALYAREHRWKGNFWRKVSHIDWKEVPEDVKIQVAQVVDCDGVEDLDPGHRLIEQGGRAPWRDEDD